jgi:hypothetical protein
MSNFVLILGKYKDFWIMGLKYTMWITVESILIGIVLGTSFCSNAYLWKQVLKGGCSRLH